MLSYRRSERTYCGRRGHKVALNQTGEDRRLLDNEFGFGLWVVDIWISIYPSIYIYI